MTRSLPALLFILILGTGVLFAFWTGASADPADTGRQFLKFVQDNDYRAALMQFGDNSCHCAPKGGYVAYLRYDMANDPSLAFLFGQKFDVGPAVVKKLPLDGEKYMMPWEKPEDTVVFLPITFPDQASRPYFVPLDMAFGLDTTEADLKAFVSSPEKDWARAFTLRLRPRLTADVIEKHPLPHQQPQSEEERKLAESLLPADLLKYQHPGEAGSIKLASGQAAPASQFAPQLPRLKSLLVGFKIVRAGVWHRWLIHKLGVAQPVIVAGDKEIKLSENDAQSGLNDK
jgi:hypothetical protein